MPYCEMSGKNVPTVVRVRIEGVVMSVAPEFSHLGVIMKDPARQSVRIRSSHKKSAVDSVLVDDVGARVQKARQQKKMTQEEFAKFLQEKVSVIAHIENGTLHPSDALAKKLEKMLHIKLYQQVRDVEDNDNDEDRGVSSSRSMTLGDMLLEKMKKK